MRKLVYYVATTIDGFIAGPDGGDPSGPDGFFTPSEGYVEHMVAEYPETLPVFARDALGITGEGKRFDTVVEGRRSYEIGLAVGVTNAYSHLRHLVFSRTMTDSPDPGVELVGTDPVAKIQELKQGSGLDIWLVGGAELAGVLLPEIDELVVKMSPVAIGAGIPLFGRQAAFDPVHFGLVDSTILPGGAAFLTYRRKPSVLAMAQVE